MLYHDFPQNDLISIIHKNKRLPQIRKRLSLNEYCFYVPILKPFTHIIFRTKDDHNLAFTARKTERMLKNFLTIIKYKEQ